MTHSIPLSDTSNLADSLVNPLVYRHSIDGQVELIETHISWVFLAGRYAYKLKKPISTPFLDYTTLQKRHAACMEEVRLGQGYSPDLYIAVVPVTQDERGVHMDGEGIPIDFAVQMNRFPANALLSRHIEADQVSAADMVNLGKSLARMHTQAEVVSPTRREFVDSIGHQALENFEFFRSRDQADLNKTIEELENWTRQNWNILHERFGYRLAHGWMRQCHGDLHCDNIIFWHGNWSAFDGIEFNIQLSNIDVISDIAFLVMDLQFRGRTDLSAVLLNAYLEATGDYHGLQVLQWYLVYRAVVRAKVASIRSSQLANQVEQALEQQHVKSYIELAQNYIRSRPVRLWITHGVSGSGKTSGSDWAIAEQQMVRLRSDVQRKRLFSKPVSGQFNQVTTGNTQTEASDGAAEVATGIYSTTSSEATYMHLLSLARELLMAGYSVLVDATFLRQRDRQKFFALANAFQADFRILHFDADRTTLEQRISQRLAAGTDASEASFAVLEHQLASQEPFTQAETAVVLDKSS